MTHSMDKPRTLDAAHGRWREILPQLGVSPTVLDGKHHPCPACGGDDRFRFHDRQKDGDHYCNGCGAGKGITLVMKVNGWTYAEAAKKVDEIIGNLPKDAPPQKEPKKVDTRGMAREQWRESQPVMPGSPVWRYLVKRGLSANVSSELRYIPNLLHKETNTFHPAMIARVCGVSGKGESLHRTYLTDDGRKADVKPARKMLPGEFPKGGAIRLAPVLTDEVGVAEGIETALAASVMFGVPVWSVISEHLMQTWEPPDEVKRIVIFADNDLNFVGQNAAYALARRLSLADGYRKRELNVSVMIPEVAGTDWNDVLLERKYARAA